MFNFIKNMVRKHGTQFMETASYTTLRLRFMTIIFEKGWIIDRNVEHLTFEMFGKKWHFSKEYEPFNM